MNPSSLPSRGQERFAAAEDAGGDRPYLTQLGEDFIVGGAGGDLRADLLGKVVEVVDDAGARHGLGWVVARR